LDLYFVNEQYGCALRSEVPVAQRSYRDEHRAKIATDVSETIFVAQWGWYSGGALKRPQLPARSTGGSVLDAIFRLSETGRTE